MVITNAYSSVRLPRMVSYLIHTAKGGFFTAMDRGSKHTHNVDTTPAHAKPTEALTDARGIVLPIRKFHAGLQAAQRNAAETVKAITAKANLAVGN